MKRLKKILIAGVPLAILLIISMAAGPCVETRDLQNGLSTFKVHVTGVSGPSSGSGTLDDPYVYHSVDGTLTHDAEAGDKRG